MPMKKKNPPFYPVALTIAGSDSGGGAGVQADLRTFNALGVFGTSVITAVTSQNPAEVRRIDAIPAEGVAAQLGAVLDRLAVKCAKSGMLFSAPVVEAVAAVVSERRLSLVCDPVMVSTSGAPLLCDDAVDAVRRLLLPHAMWITPNIPEAELLTGRSITSRAECLAAARECADRWGVSVLLKTGHADYGRGEAADFVVREGECFELVSPRLRLSGFTAHGTGCTLSAAMAAGFALGFPWDECIREAKAFVLGSLRENVRVGEGIDAMYPPSEDSYELVTLHPAEATR